MQRSIGPASGSYRRNKATVWMQDMLWAFGKTKKITVPDGIAAISATEINEIPSIAMEMLERQTVGAAVEQANDAKRPRKVMNSCARKPG